VGKIESDTMYGTLNLLVLRTLAEGPLHGLAISRQIHADTGDALKVAEGALYPALHRLERDGFVKGDWGISETRRRARFYDLTKKGRKHLEREVERWMSHANAVASVLRLGPSWHE
jgi:PadR family transcriptional regulator PadR